MATSHLARVIAVVRPLEGKVFQIWFLKTCAAAWQIGRNSSPVLATVFDRQRNTGTKTPSNTSGMACARWPRMMCRKLLSDLSVCPLPVATETQRLTKSLEVAPPRSSQGPDVSGCLPQPQYPRRQSMYAVKILPRPKSRWYRWVNFNPFWAGSPKTWRQGWLPIWDRNSLIWSILSIVSILSMFQLFLI